MAPKKDPTAPKRPLSAYMLWLKETRPTLAKPGMSPTEVLKAAGVAWALVTDRTKWQAEAVEAKERYQREVEAAGAVKKTREAPAEEEAEAPKKAPTKRKKAADK